MAGKSIGVLALGAALITGGASPAAPTPGKIIASIDLSEPFATRSPWRLTVTQGTEVHDEILGTVPGVVRPCISKNKARSCRPDLVKALHDWPGEDPFAEPHFLENARIVHPRGNGDGRALLLVRLRSLPSENGNQRISTQLLAYDRAGDRFVSIFAGAVGRENNEEVRYVADGRLKGAVVTAEPTNHAPFVYWITVHRLTPAFTYRQILRFRSATRYGDGNPLAVIDSEMPNIQQRLGLWRPGKPLPLPAGGCARPRLVRMELWCD